MDALEVLPQRGHGDRGHGRGVEPGCRGEGGAQALKLLVDLRARPCDAVPSSSIDIVPGWPCRATPERVGRVPGVDRMSWKFTTGTASRRASTISKSVGQRTHARSSGKSALEAVTPGSGSRDRSDAGGDGLAPPW